MSHQEENNDSDGMSGEDENEQNYDSQPVVRIQDIPNSSSQLSPSSSSSHYEDAAESRESFEESQNNNLDDAAIYEAEEEIETTTPAREHSYLPGTSHPLFPEELLDRRRRIRSGSLSNYHHPVATAEEANTRTRTESSRNNTGRQQQQIEGECVGICGDGDNDSNATIGKGYSHINADIYERACGKLNSSMQMELPVLELNGVVLFPGSTIPIRLRNPHWLDYLGRQIDRARQLVSNDEVQIGILTHVERRQSRQSLNQQSDSTSWTRRGSNLQILTRDNADFMNQYESFLAEFAREELARAAGGSDTDEQDNDNGDAVSSAERNTTALHRLFASTTNNERSSEQPRQHRQSLPSRPQPRPRTPSDPLIGRIGTLATITYTHEDAAVATGSGYANSSAIDAGDDTRQRHSRVWQRSEGSQIVVTALGTGRFRIISRIDDDDNQGIAPSRRRHRDWGEHADIRLYKVEPLPDEEIPMPPVTLRKRMFSGTISKTQSDQAPRVDNSKENSPATSTSYMNFHDQLVRNVSRVSPIPTMTYKKFWPWNIVGNIRSALDRVPGFDGLTKSLPPLSGGYGIGRNENDGNNSAANWTSTTAPHTILQPMRFSFWLASNMALSEKDKLHLLQMNCTVQRLRFIYDKVLEQEQHETFVCCKMCGQQLSQVSNIFTVDGSEGTTGAYVNEHGIIHQTITLRHVRESKLWYESMTPEAKDSWFPGYAWTIAYCSFCHSHLGWKFDKVQSSRSLVAVNNSADRPAVFWGLSGASVTTTTHRNPISNQESEDEEG